MHLVEKRIEPNSKRTLPSVAIAVVSFRNPARLARLLDNMKWAGVPDIPVYVFEDPSPDANSFEVSKQYERVCRDKGVEYTRAPSWGCMQGVTEFAFRETTEDWLIWVPDDVLFTRGSLWCEYSAILTYGREWVGGFQAPYWLAKDLVTIGVLRSEDEMFDDWTPHRVPQNPHWNDQGEPRAYVNLNGAGFSLNRRLWERFPNGFPQDTWRLDEYAGYMAWHLGYVILTIPGQPRIHYMGGSTKYGIPNQLFHSAETFEYAIGKKIGEATGEIYTQMMKLPGGQFHEINEFFNNGGRLC